MAAIKRPRETRNGRFWMLIELKKSCIGESDAGNQTPLTATKPRNARRAPLPFQNLYSHLRDARGLEGSEWRSEERGSEIKSKMCHVWVRSGYL